MNPLSRLDVTMVRGPDASCSLLSFLSSSSRLFSPPKNPPCDQPLRRLASPAGNGGGEGERRAKARGAAGKRPLKREKADARIAGGLPLRGQRGEGKAGSQVAGERRMRMFPG